MYFHVHVVSGSETETAKSVSECATLKIIMNEKYKNKNNATTATTQRTAVATTTKKTFDDHNDKNKDGRNK